MRRRFGSPRGGLVVALLVILSTVACQSQATPAAPTAQAPAQPTKAAAPAVSTTAPAATSAAAASSAPAPLTIKLGLSQPLSGPAAAIGRGVMRFVQMGIDDVNAKGGVRVGDKVYRFESTSVDDKNTSEGAIEAANKLVLGEKVKFLLGSLGAPWAGNRTVTEPNKVLNIAAVGTDKELGTASPFTLITASQPSARAAVLYDWLVKAFPQAKRVATIEGDDANGRATIAASEANANSHNVTLVAKEFYPVDTKDFGPLITRVLAQKPDAIDGGIGQSRGPLFFAVLKALHEQGFKGPVFAASVDTASVKSNIDIYEGVTAALFIDWKVPGLTSGENDVFDRFAKQYGEGEIMPTGLATYNSAPLLAQAMAKAGTVDDTEKLAATLRAGEWDTMWGKSHFMGAKTFGLPIALSQPIYISGVRNGKVVIVDKIDKELP